jgi:nucleotide-binding universal stress UspA family protein
MGLAQCGCLTEPGLVKLKAERDADPEAILGGAGKSLVRRTTSGWPKFFAIDAPTSGRASSRASRPLSRAGYEAIPIAYTFEDAKSSLVIAYSLYASRLRGGGNPRAMFAMGLHRVYRWMNHPTRMDGPLLICYDGSPESALGIDVAAKLMTSRQAVVLNVGLPLTGSESFAALSSVVPGDAFEELNEVDALRLARDGAMRAQEAGFAAEPRASLAAPTWQGIVDVASELDAAAIVIGSRGLSGLREVAEGSLSHQLAEHAGRPVLIVPPRHGDR